MREEACVNLRDLAGENALHRLFWLELYEQEFRSGGNNYKFFICWTELKQTSLQQYKLYSDFTYTAILEVVPPTAT
jgi:hypothetical protein